MEFSRKYSWLLVVSCAVAYCAVLKTHPPSGKNSFSEITE